MNKLLDKLKSFFTKVGNYFTSGKADADLQKVAVYIPYALPVVKEIAALTPTRADDEIVALFERYGLPEVQKYLALPAEERGGVLARVATKILAKAFPNAPERLLTSAVQLAYVGFRAEAA